MKPFLALRVAPVFAVMCLAIAAPAPAHAQVELTMVGGDHISIAIDGQPFSNFYIGGAYPKPFLAPLRTASGLIVTRRFPMETVPGESRDHPHHRGLFIGYGNINGINFWENEFNYTRNPNPDNPGYRGKFAVRRIDNLESGKRSGTVTATFEWRDPKGADVLEERRTLTFYGGKDTRTVDVDTTFTAKVNAKFADTKEGFFAIRVADSMTEKKGGLMTNSHGAQTEKQVWGKRADWVDYDGTVQGQKVGIAIFDHPQNYSHPPRWHSRAYGLFAVNPFGLKDFAPNASGEGGYTLPAGQSLRFRYRVVIHNGGVPMKEIAGWYSKYAKQVK